MKLDADGKRCRPRASVRRSPGAFDAPLSTSRLRRDAFEETMGQLIDLEAYRRRKARGLPRLATSRDPDAPAERPHRRDAGSPPPPALPRPSDRRGDDDPDAPDIA
jgi:hypothetical protein